MYVYMYMYIYLHVYMCIYVHTCKTNMYVYIYIHIYTYMHIYVHICTYVRNEIAFFRGYKRVNRSQKCILLIVQYKYIKSCSGDFYSPESDPPHKIMRYDVCYSIQLVFGFPPDRICQVEMICIGGVSVLKRHFGGAGP